MITFNKVDKVPEESICIRNQSNYTFDNPLYEEFYNLNKEYYKTKIDYLFEAHDKGSTIGTSKKMLDWLNISSVGYIRSKDDYNFGLISQLNILNQVSRDPDLKPYMYEKFYIKEIKVNIPYIPENISKSIDKLVSIDLSDKQLTKKMINKFHYLGELPKWFYSNTTIESMQEFFNRKTPAKIVDGSYEAYELLPKLNSAISELKDRFNQARELVKREARQLDFFEEKLNKYKKSKPEAYQIYTVYDEVLELIYDQLTIYQRAVMAFVGEQLVNLGETVDKMFIDFRAIKSNIKT